MRKIAFAAILSAASGLCQTPAKEPDTLQSLLAEVHQLRKDIEAMTVASQRVQIALYSLQMQDGAVGRAEKRLDEAREKCRGEEGHRQDLASEVQRLERSLSDGTTPPAETRLTESKLAQFRAGLDGQSLKVQTCEAAEAEASNQLRNDQAKLVDLQVKIENLDKTLEQSSAAK